jgi:hypothetical protein
LFAKLALEEVFSETDGPGENPTREDVAGPQDPSSQPSQPRRGRVGGGGSSSGWNNPETQIRVNE